MIAGVGDWTHSLAQRCLDVAAGTALMPKIAIDGPYAAPTQSAVSKELVIAVGAGVGITPFLSFLSSITGSLENDIDRRSPLKEAHFFWSSRSADEFLFAQKHFTRIAETPHLRARIFLHLHITSATPEGDPSAYLFRESVRRQSLVDRQAFHEVVDSAQTVDTSKAPVQLPWPWMNGSHQDVMWVGHLIDDPSLEDTCEAAEALQGRWCQNFGRLASKSSDALHVVNPDALHTADVNIDIECPNNVVSGSSKHVDKLIPVVFGRPSFAKEICAIGQARPTWDVQVYACGNDALVQDLQDVVAACNAQGSAAAKKQRYELHFERFG
jgi:ferredoxin-NADP reductase